jgi:hypothetical protein
MASTAAAAAAATIHDNGGDGSSSSIIVAQHEPHSNTNSATEPIVNVEVIPAILDQQPQQHTTESTLLRVRALLP